MKLMARAKLAIAAMAILPSTANAAITVNINEVGSDVVATSSGSLDLTGLTDDGPFLSLASIWAAAGFVSTGNFTGFERFSDISGPTQFGSGNSVPVSSASGDMFLIDGSSSSLGFATTYVSGSSISGTSTWSGQTFASLGLTPGQYEYTTPNDTVTINIGPVNGAVPEPSTWAMMIIGFWAIGFAIQRRCKDAAKLQA